MPEFDLDECRRICAINPANDVFGFVIYASEALPAACQEIERLREELRELNEEENLRRQEVVRKWSPY
jgi:hypothetical protein